ncbi:MAG: hypothetical protein HC916_10890 [Coleofasciculaceae cyanobacterium SM2_1_6]|nr:hypothetical protein [Coleofasciculaceae cyanobacterium SM2_1_6]
MAATLTGTIKVEVIPGSFGAGIYTGDFSYDDTHLTKIGSEFMTINGGNGDIPGLLSLNFRFLDFATGLTPVIYTARDHSILFPNGPGLSFENGIPTAFAFLVDPGNNGGPLGGGNGFAFGMGATGEGFLFAVQNGTIGGEGLVTLELDKPTSVDPTPVDPNPIEPPSVPENSSPFASLLAALGLGAAYLRSKLRTANN